MATDEIAYEVWLDFKQKPTIETRNFILMHYISLVKEIALRIAPIYKNRMEYEDLYSYGIFGLIDAIERYDVSKGIKFKTYATWRIKGAMIDQIRKQDWLPKSMRQKFKMVEEACRTLERKTGKYPEDEEIARHLNISVKDLNKILHDSYYYQIISMDEQLMEISEFDASDEEGPEDQYIKAEVRDTLAKAIEKLTDNERMVTSLYYFDGFNQKEIGKIMGLSESRISQLHSKALLKLRSSIKQYSLVES